MSNSAPAARNSRTCMNSCARRAPGSTRMPGIISSAPPRPRPRCVAIACRWTRSLSVPRVLRDVAKCRCLRRGVRSQDALARRHCAGWRARDFRSRCRGRRRARSRQVWRLSHAELGLRTWTGKDRAGRARCAAFLSTLCARRRRLCRGHGQPRGRKQLCRVLPDGRHRSLQPARARHRQALRSREPHPFHRRRFPEGA